MATGPARHPGRHLPGMSPPSSIPLHQDGAREDDSQRRSVEHRHVGRRYHSDWAQRERHRWGGQVPADPGDVEGGDERRSGKSNHNASHARPYESANGICEAAGDGIQVAERSDG